MAIDSDDPNAPFSPDEGAAATALATALESREALTVREHDAPRSAADAETAIGAAAILRVSRAQAVGPDPHVLEELTRDMDRRLRPPSRRRWWTWASLASALTIALVVWFRLHDLQSTSASAVSAANSPPRALLLAQQAAIQDDNALSALDLHLAAYRSRLNLARIAHYEKAP